MTEEKTEEQVVDPDANKITFYCKDCKEVAEVHRDGKKYVFNCKQCGGKNVVYGTKRGIMDYFHLKNI
jgi:Zn finger protein HypA/HybF involved in hydrogenase expression